MQGLLIDPGLTPEALGHSVPQGLSSAISPPGLLTGPTRRSGSLEAQHSHLVLHKRTRLCYLSASRAVENLRLVSLRSQDTEVAGALVPQQSQVYLNIFSMHR